MSKDDAFSGQDYLEKIHTNRGIGYWRELYLDLVTTAPLKDRDSIIELGAGSPDFLAQCPFKTRAAIDIGDTHREAFEADNIDLHVMNLEDGDLQKLGQFDIAICSDVFEHLLWPAKLLKKIPSILTDRGILISHVPNEYALVQTLRIMFGRSKGMYFHKDQEEWVDPHLRRFTDIGYRKFLAQEFRHNLKITHLKQQRLARILSTLHLPVPFCLQGGPTYISTNDAECYAAIKKMVEDYK